METVTLNVVKALLDAVDDAERTVITMAEGDVERERLVLKLAALVRQAVRDIATRDVAGFSG